MGESLLTAQNLGRKIEQRWLWRRVSLKLVSGSRLGLAGASGSGKTLLLRSLVGLDPLQEGKIIFGGRPFPKWSLPQYRTRVIYLPQRPAFFEGTVEENLEGILKLNIHRGRRYERKKVLDYLEVLGRDEDFLGLEIPTLSGGESQILALVRALQLEPQILLLDEPTASLDSETTSKVESLIDYWLEERSPRACIWTSHDVQQLPRVTQEQIELSEYL